ncbi:C39 family peptidase [Photobacterium sp. DNB22_13_2]
MKKSIIMLISVLASSSIHALDYFPSRGGFNVEVKSYQEKLFGDVFRQQYDFSCGSAAVASLLTYHYDIQSQENIIFEFMFEHGDQEKIEQQGFSMLDMKKYLDSVGLDSNGYNIPLDKFHELQIPAITIVNFDGYMHFVVIKGINQENVILGDPSRGTLLIPIDDFKRVYKGSVLLVKNRIEQGRGSFITADNYNIYNTSPTSEAITRDSLSTFSITLPGSNDY